MLADAITTRSNDMGGYGIGSRPTHDRTYVLPGGVHRRVISSASGSQSMKTFPDPRSSGYWNAPISNFRKPELIVRASRAFVSVGVGLV